MQQIPEVQYAITMIVITGVTNAVNLIDGIDGLAGSFAMVNLVVLTVLAIVLGQVELAAVLVVVAVALIIFLEYNWRPARMFMGDGGSLFLGFLMSVSGIWLLKASNGMAYPVWLNNLAPVVIYACFALPVADSLKVFLGRIRRGKSPFSADKTHLHHRLLRHTFLHDKAVKKIIGLHLLVLVSATALRFWLSVSATAIVLQLVLLSYNATVDFAQNFTNWYRRMKRLENGW